MAKLAPISKHEPESRPGATARPVPALAQPLAPALPLESIADTWTKILPHWIPDSQYEYNETRLDYEFYDERDHGDIAQMDIFIPIRNRK
jgi:hypothetical protein